MKTKIREYTEPQGFMRVRKVRVIEVDEKDVYEGAEIVPDETDVHDWKTEVKNGG